MINNRLKHFLFVTCLFSVTSIAALWSWNTLSELFDWSSAQYKHVLAIFILFMIVKWSLFGRYRTLSPFVKGNPDHSL
ncbi:hypothetical protein SAMN05216302_100359 [Nitrosomonas aestuarii]|uniref:Uncharacterized protein n=1 Tax=Nitrosomonas aestuarii TaxID=52441 RepID=A0A1I3Y6W0_9PROT|nr:hypothetical protein SAMN05216302_100359 [Nitrosomonas aestuarii]